MQGKHMAENPADSNFSSIALDLFPAPSCNGFSGDFSGYKKYHGRLLCSPTAALYQR
jgi:hypothetical protein